MEKQFLAAELEAFAGMVFGGSQYARMRFGLPRAIVRIFVIALMSFFVGL